MAIYIDDGDTVKTYSVKAKVAKAVMTLLESDDELVWSRTHPGYGVIIVDEKEREEWLKDYKQLLEQKSVLGKVRAEIEAIIGEHRMEDYDFCSGLIVARKIIDKYKTKQGE